ncbi:MAG TPA: 2-C-methyl-D-erythritol 4-phosphate cytidylyltransferase, partial [Capillimicrobium sp.]
MAVALLVAAGRGERLGASGPKAFVVLGGRPLYAWSLEALSAAPSVREVVV